MRFTRLVVCCVLWLAGTISVQALPPEQVETGAGLPKSLSPSDLDYQTWIDANQLLMFVTNQGSFAYDNGAMLGKADGLYYPRGTNLSALYAAGLWLGGIVDGALRVSLAEYSHGYVPGPMVGGTFQPDRPEFKVYKIYRNLKARGFYNQPRPTGDPEMEERWDDYHNWPVADGAPLDCDKDPLIMGDQTTWSVYNDSDPSVHTNSAGTSQGLGVEIQNTAYAWNLAGPLGTTILMKYVLINKSGLDLSAMYVAFWADPDLGDAGDDFVGCDPLRNLGYCYNATNGDDQYGSAPPAVGFRILQGPRVPYPGDSALVFGQWRPGYRNVPMTSFMQFINGTDPDNAIETYWFMQGLDGKQSGAPIIDPITSLVTPFMFSGDPTTGVGWLDCCAYQSCHILGQFTFQETFGPGGVPVDPPDNVWWSWNSTHDYYFSSDQDDDMNRLNWQGHVGEDIWEMRFTPGGSEYYDWNSDEKFPNRSPFEVWNLSGGSDGNPTDTRIQYTILDDDESGGWSPGDRIYFIEQEYQEPLPQWAEYTWNDDFRIGRIVINENVPAEGSVIRITVIDGDVVCDTVSGDRRYMLASGPFNMAVNDTQEVVMTVIVGQGFDRLSSVTALKFNSDYVQNLWEGCDCSHQGDIDNSGTIGPVDVVWMVNYALRMVGPPPPTDPYCPVINRADWDCDGRISMVDIVRMVNYVYRAPAPGPCNPCGDCLP